MRNSDHDMLAMEIDSQEASSSELDLKPADPVAGFEEIPCKDKEVEAYEVTVKHTLENLKSVLVCSEMSRAWEWRMEEHANVGAFKLLLDV